MNYTRWKKRQEPASHIDDWLMTYADMITLLLCFFAIFLTATFPKQDPAHPKKISKTVVEEVKLKDDILQGNLPFYGRTQANEPVQRIADQHNQNGAITVPIDKIMENKPIELPPVVVRAPTVPELPAPLPAQSKKSEAMPDQANDQSIANLKEIIEHLKAQGPATIEQKGDRITTFEANSAAFFDRGSATLSNAGKNVLRNVAANIRSSRFKDYQVTVEGHTDDIPIKTPQFPSNWELSTARASAVVQFFLQQSVPAQRLRAAGYADTFPKAPNRDASGKAIPANQALNRRVVIKLEKIDRND